MQNKLAKIMAIVTVIVGIMVMFGWIFDIPLIKSILPQFVSMKFTTAICFVFSGVLLYILSLNNQNNFGYSITVLFLSFLLTLLMASLLVSVFLGIKTGIEDLFVSEAPGTVNTPVAGRPALSTMLSFVVISLTGFLSFWNKKSMIKIMHILGVAIALGGSVAIIGYIFDQPFLYYNIDQRSSAMALHTAFLFLCLGIGFVSIQKESI